MWSGRRQTASVLKGIRPQTFIHASLKSFRASVWEKIGRRLKVTTVKKYVPPEIRGRRYSGMDPFYMIYTFNGFLVRCAFGANTPYGSGKIAYPIQPKIRSFTYLQFWFNYG
jgi:hypothetical protein